MLRDLYVNTISFLRKQYNFHKKEIKYTPEPQGSQGSNVSPKGTELANNFLKTLTKGILTKSKEEYNKFKDKEDGDMGENGELYRTERNLLIQIAKNGKVPSKLDPDLFDAFSNRLNYIYNNSDEITQATYKEELDGVLKA